MLAALAWRNLWRRPQRTLLSLASISIVTALLVFMLSFQLGVYQTMIATTLRIFDGYAELQPAGYAADPSLERAIGDPGTLAAKAKAAGVTASPRVNAFAILANGERSYGAAVIGVDPVGEARISSIPSTISRGRYLRPGDGGGVVLGDTLARNLGVTVGGKVTMLGQARDGSVAADVLAVTGLFHSGVAELDRSIAEMALARAQDTFAMNGSATTIALGGGSVAELDSALPAVRALARPKGIAVLDWQALEPALRDAIALKYATSMMFYVTLVVVVAFIVLNTLLMSVLERTREFAMLLALGMHARSIGLMVWIELMVLGLVGCVVGLAIGGAITLWFESHGIVFSAMAGVLSQYGLPSRLYPTLTPLSALFGPAMLLAAILLGGVAPYLRVVRITPGAAMRTA